MAPLESLGVYVAPLGTDVDDLEAWRLVGTVDPESAGLFSQEVLGELCGNGERAPIVHTDALSFSVVLAARIEVEP